MTTSISLIDVVDVRSHAALDRTLKRAAQEAGYFRVLLESWSDLDYDTHAVYARTHGLHTLAVLLDAGQQAADHLLRERDRIARQMHRQRILAEFGDEYAAAACGHALTC